jgi:rRNA maturation endonuclease Nob1
MNKQDNVQIVIWCNTCKTVEIIKETVDVCKSCGNQYKEIGWVENNG